MARGHEDYARKYIPIYETVAGVERGFPLPPAPYESVRMQALKASVESLAFGDTITHEITATDWGAGEDFYVLRWNSWLLLDDDPPILQHEDALLGILFVLDADDAIVRAIDDFAISMTAGGWTQYKQDTSPLTYGVKLHPRRHLAYPERIAADEKLQVYWINYTAATLTRAAGTSIALDVDGWLEET